MTTSWRTMLLLSLNSDRALVLTVAGVLVHLQHGICVFWFVPVTVQPSRAVLTARNRRQWLKLLVLPSLSPARQCIEQYNGVCTG